MSVPARPHWQPQGPASRCVIDGKLMGWLNCTPGAFAMAIEKATLGRIRLTACDVRRRTGDTSGGTTLEQCARVARALGVAVSVYDAGNLATPTQVARWLRAGRGVVVQGNTSAMLSHPGQRSTGGPVNHALYGNEVRGGTTDNPSEVLVYDTAADGREAGWGEADQGPTWWPWSLFLAFMAALRPASTDGGATGTRLGPGKAYAAVFADTEPHVHLRYGGTKASPLLPDRTRENGKGNVRRSPRLDGTIVRPTVKGKLRKVWQWTTTGDLYNGSRRWGGNHDGDEWVHESRLTHKGGAT